MIFLLCLLTWVQSEKELAKLRREWMRFLLKQGVPVLYLFILNVPDSQPRLWCSGEEEGIGSDRVIFPFFTGLFCGAEFTANTPVLGAPEVAGGGEGGGRRKMNGERGFALKLHRIGKVFICVRRCPYHISHSVHTAFYEANVNVRESCQAIHQQLESCQQDRDRWHLGSAEPWHPLTSGSRNCCSKTIQTRVAFQSCLARPQPARSAFQVTKEYGLYTIWQQFTKQLIGKLLNNQC